MTPRREIPFARPWITDEDRRAVARVLEGPILAHGPEGKAFEAEFAAFLGDGAHCVSVSSCMAALHLAYVHLGIGPGNEVIVPALTHVATAHAVEWVGARPVFADCDPATGNLTADRIERCVTPRTRAISVVHFAGIPCTMPAIVDLARDRGLAVVEDCALAVGARYDGRHVGLFGDAGCFSFYPVKHLTTGEGGMFVSRHAGAAEKVARLRAFGVDRSHSERKIPGMYDVPSLGLNYRMAEIPAALGRSQLARAPEILARREKNFRRLQEGLAGLPGVCVLDAVDPRARSSFYCLSVLLDSTDPGRRDGVVSALAAAGIGTSVYYPKPVPRMRYYRDRYGYDEGAFPVAARIADRSVALPVGPHLAEEDIAYMIETLRKELEARS
ncbi:MAG: DegT/DnrJ/EryC1/StrS family aminotransferase [Planctomycetes bacterium]|nr:DegT/DnrJ/EryC1/StrS family aminotransferase [Planctomycetota bacterium]